MLLTSHRRAGAMPLIARVVATAGQSRGLIVAIAMFVMGVGAAGFTVDGYADAYAWVAHTSDVRMIVGRTLGHAEGTPRCRELHRDVEEFALYTLDNAVQQQRVPGLRSSVGQACATGSWDDLRARLVDLDATERVLMRHRRERLAETRSWVLRALVFACAGAIASISIASYRQRRAMRALVESEERFRALASTSRDLIRVHDPSGRATYVSPSIKALLGYTPAEFLALPPLSLGHPEDLPRMRKSLADVQAPHATSTTLLYRLRAKDESWRWFETHTNPIHDAKGNLVRFYTTGRDVTDRVDLEGRLEQAAMRDELTGLLNRRGFQLVAGQQHLVAVRGEKSLAVIFADLDGLKTINDKLGHEDGDRAICELGNVLRKTFRESDVLARLGGDEFAVLAPNLDETLLTALLERLQAAVAAAPPIGPYPLAVSLGSAVLKAGDGATLEELIAQADQRMYENKRARKAAR